MNYHGNYKHYRKGVNLKHTILLFAFFLTIQCSDTDTECNDCGGGLLDGYLYKEVSIDDISNLAEINVNVEIGQCIRFKMVESEFSNAEIVDDCCCVQYP